MTGQGYRRCAYSQVCLQVVSAIFVRKPLRKGLRLLVVVIHDQTHNG
jgi:hypothetical protein